MPITSVISWFAGSLAPLTRGMTLGVRCACFDEEGRVFLLRHSYMPGWYLPGGGVERGETVHHALVRELEEEGGIVLQDEPSLFGVYHNRRQMRDHVLVYVSRGFERPNPPSYPNREIAEVGLFAPDALPDDTSPATRRRLAEIVDGAPREPNW